MRRGQKTSAEQVVLEAAPDRRAIAADHAGGGCRLAEEHETIRIEVVLALKPSFTRRSYVFSILLSCVQRPFLRVIRCRAKKRDRLLVLTAIPRA